MLNESKHGLQQVLTALQDDAFTLIFMGQPAFYAGDYDEADEFNGRALSLDRANIWSNCFYPTIFPYKGELDRAEKQIGVARQVLPKDSWLICCEALLWAKRAENKKP